MGRKTGLCPEAIPALEATCNSGFYARFTAAVSGESVCPLPLCTTLEIGLFFSEF